MAQFLFWMSVAAVGYTYAGYPILLFFFSRIFRKEVRAGAFEPEVTLLVAAFNEEAVIEEKIRNCLEIDYPREKLQIIVASDGSNDRTEEIVRKYEENGVSLHSYEANRGKLRVLNDSVPKARGEILIFSDATSMIARDALRSLVRNFSDPSVGCVSSVYRVRKPGDAETGREEATYWDYETRLKIQESAMGSILGAHGACYAIRTRLFEPLNDRMINDDYWIPIRILARGYRVLHEPSALAFEDAKEMAGYTRRIRIMMGNYQQLTAMRLFLSPFRLWPLFQIISHKALRLVVPFAMISLLVTNLFLDGLFFRVLLIGQLLFYGMALWGLAKRGSGPGSGSVGLARLPYYFCMINSASLVALLFLALGRRGVSWNVRDRQRDGGDTRKTHG